MLKLVIFDMDGLMFDTERVTMEAYLDTGKAWGLPFSKEHYVGLLGMNSEDTINRYRQDFGQDLEAERLYKEIGDLRNERLFKEMPVKKGLPEILEFFKEHEIILTVASGSDRDLIRTYLEMTGLSGYFRDYISSSEVECGKPAPDVFLKLVSRFRVRPQEALVLEDSPKGIAAAVAGGIPVIAVPDLMPVPPELASKCLAVVPDLLLAIPAAGKLMI